MSLAKSIVAAGALAILAAGLTQVRAADDWANVVAKAKQEGLVVVHGAPGKSYAKALQDEFSKAYPAIKIQFSGASGRTDVPKLLRERKANIFAWDVWVAGASTSVGRLKPLGVFQPLEPLLRADVKDDKNWFGGFADGWMDNEQKFFYGFDGSVQNPIWVNWDVVKKSAITSVKDLLKPEFAGKIVWDDPRGNGSGNGSSQTLFENFGEEFLRALYKHNVVFTTNRRQLAEWVVRGRYPIGIGFGENELDLFRSQGLGKNIEPLPDEFWKVQQQSSGFGSVGVVDNAPHPNAAAVYLNWLLSKEGQLAWIKVPRVSRRLDVPSPDPTMAPKPGIQYFNGQAEKYFPVRARLQEVAQQTIGQPMPEQRDPDAE